MSPTTFSRVQYHKEGSLGLLITALSSATQGYVDRLCPTSVEIQVNRTHQASPRKVLMTQKKTPCRLIGSSDAWVTLADLQLAVLLGNISPIGTMNGLWILLGGEERGQGEEGRKQQGSRIELAIECCHSQYPDL